jgi:hypothetical protein
LTAVAASAWLCRDLDQESPRGIGGISASDEANRVAGRIDRTPHRQENAVPVRTG